MTESSMYQRISEIRTELIELITTVTEPSQRFETKSDLILDDLLAVTNRLGRVDQVRRQRL